MTTVSSYADAQRFWNKVQKSEHCWFWTAGKLPQGYGRINWNGKSSLAHRVAYELTFGPIPEGAKIMHMCDNPACCNPAHLRAGTQADNVHDMWSKGRQGDRSHLLLYCGKVALLGEINPASRLTTKQVQAIRACAEASIPQKVIGELFGISSQHVSDLVNRKRWSHVD